MTTKMLDGDKQKILVRNINVINPNKAATLENW
jgi:hypothetical protein